MEKCPISKTSSHPSPPFRFAVNAELELQIKKNVIHFFKYFRQIINSKKHSIK